MNRRLAHALKADRKSTDAARILRPPGTFNFKTGTPEPVYVVRLDFDALYVPADLERRAPPLPEPVSNFLDGARVDHGERGAADPLLAIPAAEYVEALTGRTPDAGGYITCPWHNGGAERTPSLKAYDNGSWTCYGSCEPEAGRAHLGGDVFTFAARLWNLSTRDDFPGASEAPIRGPSREGSGMTTEAAIPLDVARRRAAALEAVKAAPGSADPIGAAQELTALLGLASVGLEIRGARIVGRGGSASADVFLSDGTAINFESLRDVATPKLLTLEVAACTGATPNIKGPQALRAVALLRAIGEHHAARTADEHYADLGLAYLQSAAQRPVDMDDQAKRWEAFCDLEKSDPLTDARLREVNVAQASTVLVDSEGARYVRAGWFQMYARREDPSAGPHEIGQRMVRVGWQRRGKDGRIKATRPGLHGSLVWPFYIVAADWEAQVS